MFQSKDSLSLTKQLNAGFKSPVYWNEYKTKIETKEADKIFKKWFLSRS